MGQKFKIGYLVKNVVSGDFEDTTANSAKLLDGETAYIKDKDGNVKKITGTIQTYNGEPENTTITMKEFLDTTQSADYLFFNYKGDTIPLNSSDTENVLSMNGMFQNCEVENIPSLNTDRVQYMNNMYRGSTAKTIGVETPQPRMFRMTRKNLSNIEQFMQEIGKLDEWNSLLWSNIKLNEDVKSVIGLLTNATNVENVKIINDSTKIKKLYANALGNNQSLKYFWVTNCDNIEEGIEGIVKKCPNLETLVLEKVSSELAILDLDSYAKNSAVKNLYLDGSKNLVTLYGLIALENLEHVKIADCNNIENLLQTCYNNNALKSYVLENNHIKNISINEFTKFKFNNVDYTVPYLEYFEPGCIIYAIEPERYYKIKEGNNFERIIGTIDDYIKNYNNGVDVAPMLKLNQSMNNRTELLQASLDCFLKGVVLYSTVDKKYYKKDLVTGEWVVVDEPLEYPLKQSSFTLKELSYSFSNASNLEKLVVKDATDVGKMMKTRNLGGYFWNLQSERVKSLQCKGYEDNYDLLINYDKLKYFVPGTVLHWLDDDKYYEIDENHNVTSIDPTEYLKTHDIFPTISADYNYRVEVNINQELRRLYGNYENVDSTKTAFVYDRHSRSFYKIYRIYTVDKPINEINVNGYENGTFVISNEKLCYKKVGNAWVQSNIFYTIPNNKILGIPTRYGTEEFSLDTYTNTLFVFETDSLSTTEPKQEWFEDFGVNNVIKTTNNNKLYKIVYDGTYGIEEVDESYLIGKNVLNVLMTGTYDLSIKESINFNKVVKHFEIYGVEIGSNRFGLSDDWQDTWRLYGGMSNAFKNCEKLKTLILPGISISFDVSSSIVFTEEDIKVIFENLAKVTTSKTITLNTKYNNLSRETIKIATDKGWTIAFK